MSKTIVRLRRQANRYGLRLTKNSRRDPNALDFGLYTLIDVQTAGAVNPSLINQFAHSWTLEEIETYLQEPGQ